MIAQFTLTSSESKRLIAIGVKALPSVQKAMRDYCIIISGGTTNGFVAEELLGIVIEKKSRYTVGQFANGTAGVSEEETRIPPLVITKGKPEPDDFHWRSYLPNIKPGDIFIKGGNAIDHTGLAAVAASNPEGGNIGSVWGIVMQRGVELLMPIGLEKLVPDVRTAVEFLGGHPTDEVLGDRISMMPVLGATIVTEITALEILFPVKAICVAAGGIAGSEGAVTLVVDGNEKDVRELLALIRSFKGEPPVI